MNKPSPPQSMPHTCQYCRFIEIRLPSELTGQNVDYVNNFPVQTVSGSYAASSASCFFFEWAVARFEEQNGSNTMDESWTLNITVDVGRSLSRLGLFWKNRDDKTVWLPQLNVLAESDNPAARRIAQRPERLPVFSKAATDQFRTWISNCNSSSHSKCQTLPDTFMPSAVLKIVHGVGEEPKLRIVRSPPYDKYVALSYCWGKGQSIKATRSTILELTQNINFHELPKTLQDAVTTTSELGCRFLWVDVLCIVQDDEIQIAKEIALMAKIYESAYVTISAARSRSSDQGFLQDIVIPPPLAPVFQFPFLVADSTPGSILCFTIDDGPEPIDTRAWAFQEFFLSRRIIRFGTLGVTWLCSYTQKRFDEEKLSMWNWDDETAILFSRTRINGTIIKSFPLWSGLVTEYTNRELSYPGDRVSAISGIASKLGGQTHDSYIAGIWRHHLPRALMWAVVSSPKPRPSLYRAPSWSWTSVNGGISEVIYGWIKVEPELEILSFDREPVEASAPYGNLMSASMTVRGWVRRLYWGNSSSTLIEKDHSQSGGSSVEDILAYTAADAMEDASHTMLPVWCLQVCGFDSVEGPFGIILSEEDGNVFKRRGCFYQYSSRSDILKDRRPRATEEDSRERNGTWKSRSEYRELVII